MPEGPEIRINYDLLKEVAENKTLIALNFLSGKYVDKPEKFKEPLKAYKAMRTKLPTKITKVGVRGKFIWIELGEIDWYLGVGFGMTGRLTQDETANHHRVELLIEGEAPLYYNDTRNFGNWFFWNGRECLDKKLKELGPDLLESKLTKDEVSSLFRKKFDKKEITQALMSQKVLAGVGNYLKCEGLYASKIWPYAIVENLTDTELFNLYKMTQKIAEKAYDIETAWEEERPYEDFQEYMKIYNKTKDPEGNKVIKVTDTKDKRTTHYVKEVQTKGKK